MPFAGTWIDLKVSYWMKSERKTNTTRDHLHVNLKYGLWDRSRLTDREPRGREPGGGTVWEIGIG